MPSKACMGQLQSSMQITQPPQPQTPTGRQLRLPAQLGIHIDVPISRRQGCIPSVVVAKDHGRGHEGLAAPASNDAPRCEERDHMSEPLDRRSESLCEVWRQVLIPEWSDDPKPYREAHKARKVALKFRKPERLLSVKSRHHVVHVIERHLSAVDVPRHCLVS